MFISFNTGERQQMKNNYNDVYTTDWDAVIAHSVAVIVIIQHFSR